MYGWNYRTLEGHLERGQMDQEVRKWLDTGEVEFHIHAFSQPSSDPSPIVRLGFRVFGRHTQVKFYRRACRRMEALTLGVLGQLGATANWHRIAREWLFGDPPSTELGEAEEPFHTRRAAPAA